MIIVFDFDGIFVDIYLCIEDVFKCVLEKCYCWFFGKVFWVKLFIKIEF